MAKPFYSQEEVTEKLGKSPEQLKELVQAGQLREFRDAGKIFYKADDVDRLAGGGAADAATDEVGLSSGDSGEITLELADEPLPEREPPAPPPAEAEGTSFIGLALPAEEDDAPAPAPAKREEDAAPSSAGIGVFDEDELEIDADPMAKTQITTGPTSDQVTVDSAGSGSGLLDLTRESDDTSLGAELLDEVYPGAEEPAAEPAPAKPVAKRPTPPPAEEPEPAVTVTEVPIAPVGGVQVVYDPTEGMFSGLLVGALLLFVVAGAIGAGVLQGYLPSFTGLLTANFWYLVGGAALLPLLTLLIGWLIGRSAAPRVR